jgi:hypothetical protein
MSNSNLHHDSLNRSFRVERYAQVSASLAHSSGARQDQIMFNRQVH